MTIDLPSANALKNVDRALRGEIKRILHLPQSVTDCVFYARKRDGGLGFPNLATQIRVCGLRAGLKLILSEDPLVQNLAEAGGWAARLEHLARQLDLGWPCDIQAVEERRRELKLSVWGRWAELSSQEWG